jgi:class 3 adenylate cyclase
MSGSGDERVGDDDRQRVIDLLRVHTGAGRLTLDEFSDRAGEVFAARTRRELDAVLANLPPGVDAAPGPAAAAGGEQLPAGPQRRARRTFIAIMSGSRARGRWRAPRRVLAVAFWGGVHIDMRDAEIEGPVIDITAWAIMGGVHIRVPKGIPVDLRGLVVMGGAHDATRAGEPLPGAPLVRVHARGLWGGVSVSTARERGERSKSRAEYYAERDAARAARREANRSRHRHGGLPPHLPGLPGPSWHDRLPPMPGMPDHVTVPFPGQAAGPPAPPAPPAPAAPPAPPAPAAPPPPPAAAAPAEPTVTGDDGAARAGANGGPRPPSGTLTMMVTDIVGSTGLAVELGDRRWMEILHEHNALVRAQVAKHAGTEVKAQGDGFLVVFASARRAILAAVDVQRALADYRTEHPDQPVEVRIGLHTGEIVDVDGDVFGQNVIVAVRIADHAAPGEIMVSGLTRDLTLAGGDLSFDAGEQVDLKGMAQPWRVHRVSWAPTPA